MPVPIKHPTATIDRFDNLGNPHTPCPLVQPLPIFVPNPTNRPANGPPIHPICSRTNGGSKTNTLSIMFLL